MSDKTEPIWPTRRRRAELHDLALNANPDLSARDVMAAANTIIDAVAEEITELHEEIRRGRDNDVKGGAA